MHEIISCTTRPPRPNELDGINYHFLTKEEFLKEKYVERCEFNNWYYGTREKDLSKDKMNLGVFNLSGIEALLKNPEIDLFVIYLKTEDKLRLIRQLQRDSSDIQEILSNASLLDGILTPITPVLCVTYPGTHSLHLSKSVTGPGMNCLSAFNSGFSTKAYLLISSKS